jgi:hypothetical protein
MVVVGDVAVQHCSQVVLVDDEQAVGDFASDGADESFGVAVGSWAPWRDLHDGDAGVGQDGVEGGGELSGPVTDQEPEAVGPVVEVHEHVTSLLGGPGSVGVRCGAEDMDVARGDSITKNTYTRFRVMAQSTWKKSQASMLAA